MTILDLERRLGLTALCPYEDAPIKTAYTSDLLSDVIANAEEDSVLITLQAHKNTVACATLVGIVAIVFTGGHKASEEVVEAAQREKIALFRTTENQFQISYKVAELLGLTCGA